MIERSEQLAFALESGEPVAIVREPVGQNLQRNVAPESRVARAENQAHAARAKSAGDFIWANPRARGYRHRRIIPFPLKFEIGQKPLKSQSRNPKSQIGLARMR